MWSKMVAGIVLAGALLATAGCNPGGEKVRPTSAPIPTATATKTMCSPLPLPSHAEVEAAVTSEAQEPGYEGPLRRVKVEEVFSSLVECGNRAAQLKVTYAFTDLDANYRRTVEDESLNLIYCSGKWVREKDSVCP